LLVPNSSLALYAWKMLYKCNITQKCVQGKTTYLTLVCTMQGRLLLIARTTSKGFTSPVSLACLAKVSKAMNVPLLPTPALKYIDTRGFVIYSTLIYYIESQLELFDFTCFLFISNNRTKVIFLDVITL